MGDEVYQVELPRQATLDSLPAPFPDDLIPKIAASVAASGRKIVVLDDDPTGTQTVYGIPVLTVWDVGSLEAELRDPGALVYILTNARSLPEPGAYALNLAIAANLRAAQSRVNRPVEIISRSDSTLRGHFPAEIFALCAGLGVVPDALFLVPCFFEGGRYTLDDTHYVAEGDLLIPAAQTEYARDAYFGYTRSNLRDWIAEKYARYGKPIPDPDVVSLSISDLRERGVDYVAGRLMSFREGQHVVINAAEYRDLEVFVMALAAAERSGKTFMARSAASFVRVRAGLPARGLLKAAELLPGGQGDGVGGLLVAGSYIEKSARQIAAALQLPGVCPVEVDVKKVLDEASRAAEIDRALRDIDSALRAGQDAALFTSRERITSADRETNLNIGGMVSAALVEIVRRIERRPRWLIAKGGITASDTATKGLGVRRAMVLGQILPGVPVWQTGAESRWPGLTYVVFPGNVGGDDSIARAVSLLRGKG